MILDDALDWFRLDPATVSEAKLNQAFRRMAKELHPDSKTTFVEKKAAHENYIAAGNARDLIAKELRK